MKSPELQMTKVKILPVPNPATASSSPGVEGVGETGTFRHECVVVPQASEQRRRQQWPGRCEKMNAKGAGYAWDNSLREWPGPRISHGRNAVDGLRNHLILGDYASAPESGNICGLGGRVSTCSGPAETMSLFNYVKNYIVY
jgi:hypothetical protein